MAIHVDLAKDEAEARAARRSGGGLKRRRDMTKRGDSYDLGFAVILGACILMMVLVACAPAVEDKDTYTMPMSGLRVELKCRVLGGQGYRAIVVCEDSLNGYVCYSSVKGGIQCFPPAGD